MTTLPEQPAISNVDTPSTPIWLKRSLIARTILFWMIIGALIFLGLGAIIGPIVLLLIAAAVAYVLFPLVKIFGRFMPHFLAILATYVLVLIVVILLLFFLAVPFVDQLTSLIHSLQTFNKGVQEGQYPAYTEFLNKIGISQGFLAESNQALTNHLQHLLNSILSLVGSAFTLFIEVIIVSSVSIYLIVDGPRVFHWLKNSTPLQHRPTIRLFVDSVDRVVGGMLRGVLFLASLMALIITVGASIIGVPYALLIGVIVFICEFIPQIGAYISGLIGILIALTQGWEVALIYGIFVTLVQGVLDAQVLAPRILGHAVGLHPVVSLFSMLIFGALFGLLGAILAIPIVGVASVFVYASWKAWQAAHPDQFSKVEEEAKELRANAPELDVAET
jgi:predicted PurR-regulated permease PerM